VENASSCLFVLYTVSMSVTLDLPPELVDAFGDELERKAIEGLLLQLVQKQRMSVAKAGEILGLARLEAIRWYTSHGHPFPDWDEDEWQHEFDMVERLRVQGHKTPAV
jgi:hypothetical protein